MKVTQWSISPVESTKIFFQIFSFRKETKIDTPLTLEVVIQMWRNSERSFSNVYQNSLKHALPITTKEKNEDYCAKMCFS